MFRGDSFQTTSRQYTAHRPRHVFLDLIQINFA